MNISDKIAGTLRGRVEVIGPHGPLFSGPNQVTNFGKTEFIRNLLAGDLNSLVWKIAVGEGGDCDILPPHNDTGMRVGPDPAETEIRALVAEVDITNTSKDAITGAVTYNTLVKREQANSPNINELALLTRDGQMIAHFVTAALVPMGRAEKKPKDELMFLIIRWTLEYIGA
jgi:hypothetical protein